MVQQYLDRKKEYSDCMLLFQVGDFYEFFGDDARRASHLLNLALTKKSKQANELEEMCGFPLTSLDSYVEKLSVISARKRGYKSLVDRQVVRIVTPGSLVEDTMLTPDENNYLASLYFDAKGHKWGLAWADVSTGEFVSTTSTSEKLASAILRCSPKEILLPADMVEGNESLLDETKELLNAVIPLGCMKTYRPSDSFSSTGTKTQSKWPNHDAELAALDSAEHAAASAILDYIDFTQTSVTSLVRAPLHVESSDHMIIDASAWKALEVSKSLSGSKGSSLLHAIDSTVTPGGSRLLASHLSSPLMNLEHLEKRLDAVTHFFTQESLLRQTRKQLAEVFDMERSLQRLSIGVATPKDLKNVATTIDEAKKLVTLLEQHDQAKQSRLGNVRGMPALLQECCERLFSSSASSSSQQREKIKSITAEIHAALMDDFTALNSKNEFVRTGYSEELDHWRSVLHHDPQSTQKQKLQEKYRQLLGSTRLRVVYQAEKGFFIDIPHEENSKLLKNEASRHILGDMTMIQSLKNSVRYRTDEIRDLNRELLEASQEVIRIENEIFESLRAQVLAVIDKLQAMAGAISHMDVVCSHAQVALDRNFTRPLLDASRELHIEDGRHAVVEAAHLRGRNSRNQSMRAFTPNSLHFAPSSPQSGSCWLLTGPNMGGKSTFLRQNAHLVILAQMGSYVPAKFARIGLVDKLFCRVGSADDLASDKSTFMVEMQETSTILTQATSRSLVLMDEVGRGTSVNDGIAIAGAVLEALCEKQVRTLFATHFTVLSELVADTCKREMQLHRMEVLERRPTTSSDTQLVFSHRVVQGLAQQSYGINTAALAGCPAPVVDRATELLDKISSRKEGNDPLPRIKINTHETPRLQDILSRLESVDGEPQQLSSEDTVTIANALRVLLHGAKSE
uniref:DNA mismatch repair proteins mutS family domain-containing protein n=1 Tax=Globisporangium ultimum (strain ATCC 200006 / CBS 805.95 / DAOM BR144) TaxID=431595 RepID=K3W5J1_GLOUD